MFNEICPKCGEKSALHTGSSGGSCPEGHYTQQDYVCLYCEYVSSEPVIVVSKR